MKTFAVTLGALATLVAAQEIDIPSLPACGQFCANDMLNGQAPGLGCSPNDIACVCQNRNFIFGLRDCSAATCGSEDARRIVEFGISLCRDAGVEITTGAGGEPTPTSTEGGEGSTGGAGGSVSTILTTISSDGTVITTPIATTTIGGGSETTGTDASGTDASGTETSGAETTGTETSGTENGSETPGSSTTSGTEELVSTITSDGTTLTTTFSTPSSDETGSGSSTETDGNGDGSATSTTEDGAAMPQRTLAPVGVIAAGLAVLLL